MAAYSSFFLSLSTLLSLLSLSSSCSSPPKITTLSVTPFLKTPHSSKIPKWQWLNHHASSSLARALHLKHPPNSSSYPSPSSITKAPLFPHGYGSYSVTLSFGTPPQPMSFIMDTGSSLTWFPCTQGYDCSMCDFQGVDPKNISVFIPTESTSAKLLDCKNPKCSWLFGPDVQSQCTFCSHQPGNCTDTCPGYMMRYGSGSTTGLLLSDTLNFTNKNVGDFVVGCSLFSTGQPAGIAGFGRGPESLPSQMGLSMFSYCLVSHQLDDTPVSSDLLLVAPPESDSGHAKTANVSYTPFRRNPATTKPAFQKYYYVTVRKITVGSTKVKVPYQHLVPGSEGNGGTIVDSGTTFTFMEKDVFELVVLEFENQMANYTRASDMENLTGLRPCFNISAEQMVLFPDLIFHFKGGSKMALPLANYFLLFGDVGVVCMTIVTNNAASPGVNGGPSIILGNYQQQNFYLEYDLENEKFGFHSQICQ